MGLTSKFTSHPTPLEDDLLYGLRLIRSHRVGAVTWHRLVREHNSARAALDALPEVARQAKMENYNTFSHEAAIKEIESGLRIGATPLLWGAPGYPKSLCDLADAPPIIWVKGNVSLLQKSGVAIVGARNASSLGLRMAHKIAAELGQAGLLVISGLARGIDSAAHKAALPTGTVALQPGGVDVVVSEETRKLTQEIAESGCLVSEQPIGMRPQVRHFPRRNRLISGLSRAVIVVEAASQSGSLITAREALDQGREVLAVPGHPFDARASGCNMLLRDGATLARNAADVFEAIGLEPTHLQKEHSTAVNNVHPLRGAHTKSTLQPSQKLTQQKRTLPGPIPHQRPLSEAAQIHLKILDRLSTTPITEDQIIRDLAMPASVIAAQLVHLELDGKVERQLGGITRKIK